MIEEQSADELERRRNRRLNIGARDLAAADAALRKAGFDPRPVRDADPPLLELREARALEVPDSIARLLVEAGVPPTHLAVAQEDLEQHFMRLTADAEPRNA
jgi:ABC-2 type transport system ATP-binding protein